MSTALKVRRSIDNSSIEELRAVAIQQHAVINQKIKRTVKDVKQKSELRPHQLDWINEDIRINQSIDQSTKFIINTIGSVKLSDNQTIKQSINQSNDQLKAFSLELKAPIDRINQSTQSIKQSNNQSNNQKQAAEATRLIQICKIQQTKIGVLINQSINQSINELSGFNTQWIQSIEHSINQSNGQSNNQSINQSIQHDPLSMFDYDNPAYEVDQSVYQSVYQSINQTINQDEFLNLIETRRVQWQMELIENLNQRKESFNQSINQLKEEQRQAVDTYNQSNNLSIDQTINQPNNESRPLSSSSTSSRSSINQSYKQSNKQSNKQSEDERMFQQHVSLVYKEYSHRNQSINHMISRLKLECPNQSPNQIAAAINQKQSLRFIKEKKLSLIEQSQREIKQLINQSLDRFTQIINQTIESINQSIKQSINAEQQRARHDLLNEQKSLKEQRDRIQSEINQMNQIKIDNETKARAEQEKIIRQSIKQSINQYHSELDRQRARAESINQSNKQTIKLEQQEEAKEAKDRLKVREQLQVRKQDEFRAKKAEKLAQIRALEARLEAIRAEVTKNINVDRDFDRLIAPTIASRLPDQSNGPLFVNHGYDDDKTLSDPRTRLAAALFQAGLTVESEAVWQALSSVKPHREERREMKSTVFAEN